MSDSGTARFTAGGLIFGFGIGGVLLALGATWYLLGRDPERVDPGGFWDPEASKWGGLLVAGIGGFWLALMAIGVGLIVLARRRQARRVATGRPAIGVLVEVRDTGTMINNQPRLVFDVEIHPADGSAPYRATKRAVVPHGSLGGLMPGAPFPVSVRRNDPSKFEFIDQGQFEALGGPKVAPGGTPRTLPPDVLARVGHLLMPEALAEATVLRSSDGAAGPPAQDRIGEIERLAALHRSGALTDQEFAAEKARLMGGHQ